MLVAVGFVPMPPLLNPSLASGAAFELDTLRSTVFQVVEEITKYSYCVIAPLSAQPLLDWLLAEFPLPTAYQYVADTPTEPEAASATDSIRNLVDSGVDALLVVGDGSASRSPKAPGYFDDRAVDFDSQVEQALRSASADRLASLDYSLAHELDVAGRATWPIAAAITHGGQWRCDLYDFADPYGVAYFAALWRTGIAGMPSDTPSPA